MANPSVTYTFVNGATSDATQVNQNFTDVINALTDSTKSISIDAITADGTATFNGSVNVGNSSVDDLTITASLASSLPIKTNNTFDIGSATLGLANLYLGSAGGFTTKLKGSASASYTLTLPPTAGSSRDYAQSDGSGGLTFVPLRRSRDVVSNYGLTGAVAANALTIALKGADGSDASSTNPVDIVHRNATAATGTPTTTTVTAAMSIVVPSSATLGHISAVNQYVWVYLIMGAATEIAVSGSRIFDEGSLQSATAISSGSTSATVLYATSNHTTKPIRLIGRIKSNQAAAGTWATAPSEISVYTSYEDATERSEVWAITPSGYGSTNTKIRRFTATNRNTGSAITYADSATNGTSFTINEDGLYAMTFMDTTAISTTDYTGISINSNQLTSDINTITEANLVGFTICVASSPATMVATIYCKAGDVLRPHTLGVGKADAVKFSKFMILKLRD